VVGGQWSVAKVFSDYCAWYVFRIKLAVLEVLTGNSRLTTDRVKMLHIVIMAGGAGTRFWPESRAARPKQLLPLAGQRTMLQMAVDRLGSLASAENLWIATGAGLMQAVGKQLPQISSKHILGEPCKRDTAPCIGLAALLLARTDPQATMVVTPADQVISPDEKYQQAI
jgi:mannose-1-phosphate guanylyltransferase